MAKGRKVQGGRILSQGTVRAGQKYEVSLLFSFSFSYSLSFLSLPLSLSHHAHSLVHVTVAEDDEWRLPSQLQRNLLQVTQRTAATGNYTQA